MFLHSPRRVLLIANGEPVSRALSRAAARRSDYVVAADGGANSARSAGLRPDIIIGDLDSITPATRKRFSSTPLLYVARQDNTDLEKALDVLASRHAREVSLIGATGGRLDFTLGNLAVLWNYTSFMKIRVLGDGYYAEPVLTPMRLALKVGTVVSLIPFGPCSGVTLRGFRYPLKDATLRIGEIGVSNVVSRPACSVRVKKGHLLIIVFVNPLASRRTARGHARSR